MLFLYSYNLISCFISKCSSLGTSSLNSFQNKFVGDAGTNSSKLHGYDIPIERICDDFEQAIVKYNFIDKDLHQIIIRDYQNDADYLKSLKYYSPRI